MFEVMMPDRQVPMTHPAKVVEQLQGVNDIPSTMVMPLIIIGIGMLGLWWLLKE